MASIIVADAHGVHGALDAHKHGVDDEREDDRGNGTEVQLGREAAPVALEDEEAQAAEAVAEDRGHRHERDRADRRRGADRRRSSGTASGISTRHRRWPRV